MTTPPIMIVTGMSGAGKTTVLHHLEDLGYESVDNLPLHLMKLITEDHHRPASPLAIGLDVRTRDFSSETVLQAAQAATPPARLIFLDCDDVILERRYTETRRKHPLADDLPLGDAISLERVALAGLKERADLLIDTTDMAPQDLKQMVDAEADANAQTMRITVMSFSYRYGLPREADLVFDARFLRNPHYEPGLKDLTGLDENVQAFISEDQDFQGFVDHIQKLLGPIVPRYRKEGKSYLTIAFGCTGGRHRSVFAAEMIRNWLVAEGETANLRHRELDRSAGNK